MSALHQVVSEHDFHTHPTHSVQLYGAGPHSLTVNVARYIAEGLRRGEGVLVIANPDHSAAFQRQLELIGSSPSRAIKQQQLLFLDAETTLDSFMLDGLPDQARFEQVAGHATRRVRGKNTAAKRAYSEMIGVLWQRRQMSAAIRLEELWNKLLRSVKLQLFCGYPIDIFDPEFQTHSMEDVLPGADGDAEKAARWALKEFTPERAHDVPSRTRPHNETEKGFRALIEHSSDAVLHMDLHGEVLYASPSTMRVLGYSPEEISGRNILELTHPDDREDAIRSAARARIKPGRAIQFEIRVHSAAGDWHWVEGTVTDLSGDQAAGGLVWNGRDISERKAAEQRLHESQRRLAVRERHLQAVLDSMPECVKVLGRDGEVLEMNAAGLRMLEADGPDQVLGQQVYPLIDESDRAAFRVLNENVFKGGPGGSLEFSITGFKGSRRTFETNMVPLRDESSRVVGTLSATRDVTERNATEGALRRANEGLEQFAYAAAHDLQEPIRNVILSTQLLAEKYRDKLDPQAEEFMTITVEGAQRMEALVHDLLTYARSLDSPNGRHPSTNANEVLGEVLANLRTAIDDAGAEVVCGDLPTLPIYRVHLVQLLQNLIGNALKYRGQDPPRIEISAVERPGDLAIDELAIRVRDNGIGISPSQRERIFGIFKRLHDRKIPGNGIGLAICRRIVSHYEGRIWVEPDAGQGATFVFSLPRHRPPAAR